MIELHMIKKGSKLLLPITNGKKVTKQICIFNHLDGMYSHISLPDGGIVHLSRFAKLKKVDNHYELVELNG